MSTENKASALVGQAKEWAKNYGEFTKGPEGAALSAPLRFRGAWDRNDADVLAEAFADNGSMLIGDEQLKGREAIRSYVSEAFSGDWSGSRIDDEPVDVKFLDPDCAMVISLGGVLKAGETALPPDRKNRTTWVVVRERGEWKLFSYQSSPIKG